jgi:hypothetical protein
MICKTAEILKGDGRKIRGKRERRGKEKLKKWKKKESHLDEE